MGATKIAFRGLPDSEPRLRLPVLAGLFAQTQRPSLDAADINVDRGELTIRDGKGGKDRVTMLLSAVKGSLLDHLRLVKAQHDADLQTVVGVGLPVSC